MRDPLKKFRQAMRDASDANARLAECAKALRDGFNGPIAPDVGDYLRAVGPELAREMFDTRGGAIFLMGRMQELENVLWAHGMNAVPEPETASGDDLEGSDGSDAA